jgi:hypothetical protein
MKNIYLLILVVSFANLSFGQDTLKTEIVFTTDGSNPVKVYKVIKENHFYYASGNSIFDSDNIGHTHYPSIGTSYEREYLLTAPGRIFVPNNKEVSYVIVDNNDMVRTRFTTTTDGRRQVWNLVPVGKNYKTGQRTFVLGLAGLLASGALYIFAVSQDLNYKADVNHYKMAHDFYSRTGINPDKQIFFSHASSSPPNPPSDNRMGYGIPVLSSTLSIAAIITGMRMKFKHSPRAEKIE